MALNPVNPIGDSVGRLPNGMIMPFLITATWSVDWRTGRKVRFRVVLREDVQRSGGVLVSLMVAALSDSKTTRLHLRSEPAMGRMRCLSARSHALMFRSLWMPLLDDSSEVRAPMLSMRLKWFEPSRAHSSQIQAGPRESTSETGQWFAYQ